MKLLYHECLRVFADKIINNDDKEWFIQKMNEICKKNFDLQNKKVKVIIRPAADTPKS
jgi:hypothetical protein